MENKLIAKASIKINASVEKVWDAFVNPSLIKKYMFGTNVKSDWKEGSTITWSGEWEGKAYEDKGKILKVVPGKILSFSYFSSMSGLKDAPENYKNISIDFIKDNEGILVKLTQDNNATPEAKDHSEKNWQMILTSVKNILEN